jgi:CAAX prenyl protease-like protein
MNKGTLARIAPFALFMAFIGIEEVGKYAVNKGMITFSDESFLFLYPIKIVCVALVLLFYFREYSELRITEIRNVKHLLASLLLGILVFVLWINMDWFSFEVASGKGFNPQVIEDSTTRILMIGARLAGAVLLVPIMEEIFWRSFLIRFLIKTDFSQAPIGQFTWASCIITVILFGLEHNLILAGIIAGLAYNLILYFTRSICHCVLSHALTNLLLGIYVLQTGHWHFW